MDYTKSNMAATGRHAGGRRQRPQAVRFSDSIECYPIYKLYATSMSPDELVGEWERQKQQEGFQDTLAWVCHLLEIHQCYCKVINATHVIACSLMIRLLNG